MRDRIMGDKKKEYRDKRTGMQTVRSAIFAIVLIITGFTSIIYVAILMQQTNIECINLRWL